LEAIVPPIYPPLRDTIPSTDLAHAFVTGVSLDISFDKRPSHPPCSRAAHGHPTIVKSLNALSLIYPTTNSLGKRFSLESLVLGTVR